jgi:site-specific DNA-cytosine methylase
MGLMLAEPGFHTRCFVEWEEHPRSTLIAAQRAGYLAPAPIWDDVTTFDGRPFRGAFDTVLAGYPCQPFSQAGQRRGEDDERHLWPDVARIIREVEPEWVFLENVAGHITLGLETVLRELWGMGWTPAAGAFSAAETGAPHERLRVFIVAHRDCERGGRDTSAGASGAMAQSTSQGFSQRGSTGQPKADAQGRSGMVAEPERYSGARHMADASGAGSQGREQPGPPDQRHGQAAPRPTAESGGAPLFPPGPGDSAAWAEVLGGNPLVAPAISVGDVKRACDHFAQMVESGELAEKEVESDLRLCIYGMAERSRILRLLGNGVTPITAALAWRTLSAAHGLHQ